MVSQARQSVDASGMLTDRPIGQGAVVPANDFYSMCDPLVRHTPHVDGVAFDDAFTLAKADAVTARSTMLEWFESTVVVCNDQCMAAQLGAGSIASMFKPVEQTFF